MICRLRVWREAGGQRQSNYFWSQPAPFTETLPFVEMLEATAYDFIIRGWVTTTPFDVRWTEWEGQVWSDDLHRLSSWFHMPFQVIAFGAPLLTVSLPELCVQLEFTGPSGKTVPHRLGFVPAEFLTAHQNIQFVSRAIYADQAELWRQRMFHVSLKAGTVEPYSSVWVSPEVTTLNSRRRPVPFRLAGPQSP